MLFLLNSPERFICTVQQSKAKANKQYRDPTVVKQWALY